MISSRMEITMNQLKEALSSGTPCFYFYDDSNFLVYNEIERMLGKRPFFDNGHPIPELNLSQKDSIEHMLKDSGLPLGQGYYVLLR